MNGKLNRLALFLFYDRARGRQARLSFSKDKKHMDVIIVENGITTAFTFSGRGIDHRNIRCKDINILMRRLNTIPEIKHMVLVRVFKEAKNRKWYPLVTNSCNEVCRKIARVETGWTFNPEHLYRKLINDAGTNFEFIVAWSK